MTKYKSYNEYSSRLARQEAKRFTHQALLFGIAALALMALVIFIGIPLTIKGAIFIGNIRSSNTPVSSPDTLPPAAPQLIPPPEATNSATLSLSGYGEPGSTVSIFINGSKQAESLIDGTGSFTFNDLALIEGSNELFAQSKNSNNQDSPKSAINTIKVYQEKPELTLTKPSDGDNFYGFNAKQMTIEGMTGSDNTVMINDRQVFVTTSGTFKQTYELKEGENPFTVTATDPAGNTTTETLKVTYSP